MAFGTPIYMAPEQALGNPMDGRADLYAAATVAYEMLCGRGLTKKPGDRYASAEMFLAAVEEALSTREGGQTDLEFDRVSDTGSQPLVGSDGGMAFDADPFDVNSAIEEAISLAPSGPRVATPNKGAHVVL